MSDADSFSDSGSFRRAELSAQGDEPAKRRFARKIREKLAHPFRRFMRRSGKGRGAAAETDDLGFGESDSDYSDSLALASSDSGTTDIDDTRSRNDEDEEGDRGDSASRTTDTNDYIGSSHDEDEESDRGESMYRYEALPIGADNYIRRLVICPGTDEPLEARLETIPLTNTEEQYSFKAMSYVWGKDEKDTALTVDCQTLWITRRLYELLQKTRQSNEPVAVWVDAICIDQKDEQEKAQQVSLMGQIYAKSCCTLISFNDQKKSHARCVAALIDEVEAFMDQVFKTPGFSGGWNSFPWPDPGDKLLRREWRGLWTKLVQKRWFGRGWVVQEAALGRDARVRWAGVEIQWMSILRVHAWLEWRGASRMAPIGRWRIPTLHTQMYALMRPEEAMTFLPEEEAWRLNARTTLEVLHFARKVKVTQPKDRIYAFMALPTSDKVMQRLRLQPDYRQTTSHLDVYWEFAIQYLEKTSDLDLLSFVQHDNNYSDALVASESDENPLGWTFPSWIPRWDHGRSGRPMFNPKHRKIQSNTTDVYTLGATTARQISLLGVSAIILDPVEYVSCKVKAHSSHRVDLVKLVVSLWRDVSLQSNQLPRPHQSRLATAFLSALLRGGHSGNHSVNQNEFRQSQRAFQRLLENDTPDQPVETYINDQHAQRVSRSAVGLVSNHRFVILRHGIYGIAPKCTSRGDVCAVILGTRYPFILRKVAANENHYKVIGAAYVQSKMFTAEDIPRRLGEDEQCEDWRDRDLATKQIYLC